MLKPSRRGLITGITSLIASPALVRAESLMKISPLKQVENEFPGTLYLSWAEGVPVPISVLLRAANLTLDEFLVNPDLDLLRARKA